MWRLGWSFAAAIESAFAFEQRQLDNLSRPANGVWVSGHGHCTRAGRWFGWMVDEAQTGCVIRESFLLPRWFGLVNHCGTDAIRSRILHVYTRGVLPTSGESPKTSQRVVAYLPQ
jgi:hypothetical protein